MDDRHQRVGDIVYAALALSPEARCALVDRECAEDEALRADVESMLRASHPAETFLEHPALRTEAAAALAQSAHDLIADPEHGLPAPGDVIGPYTLIEIIDQGGFGVVWLAERREPMVQRVALKIIKPGMDSRAVIARFDHERQALAVMDHPHIARVFDGGVTPLGRPYFVMEHVAGVPIAEYCDAQRLTMRQRLELFIPVCLAVQHAHNKGIIHRDLKSANVLVAEIDNRPAAKVIDFGIAKAIGGAALDQSVLSIEGQLIGTPEYSSPEQAEGRLDVDTRTDVYSLGVMLYELLVGRLPFDSTRLRRHGLAAARRMILNDEPPRPGSLLAAMGPDADRAAAARHDTRASMIRALRRELEWIPLKAMRKDRERRYASPKDLGDDLQRYLDGHALSAAPESRLYLARKLLRRHRLSAAALFAIVIALTIAAVAIGRAELSHAKGARDRILAEYEQYHSGLSYAQDALDANDVASARKYLLQTPTALRGWEWKHLLASCDQSLKTLPFDPNTSVDSIAISADGVRAAIGLYSGVILLYDWQRNAEPRRLLGHTDRVTSLAFSRDGLRLLSASSDDTARMWSTGDGQQLFSFHKPTHGFNNAVWTADESRVIYHGDNGAAAVLDGTTGSLVSQFDARSNTPTTGGMTSIRGDGSLAATGLANGNVEVWSLIDGGYLFTLPGGRDQVQVIPVFSPDGSAIAQVWDNHVRLYDSAAGLLTASLDHERGSIVSMAFSSDGSRLVTASSDRTARVWRASDGHEISRMLGHDGWLSRAMFIPGRNDRVLTASHDLSLRCWDADTGDELARLRGHERRPGFMDFSQSASVLLTSDQAASVRVWDPRGARPVGILSIPAEAVNAASFSSDGARIVIPASGGKGGVVGVWTADHGEHLLDLEGHTKDVWSAVFSPNDEWIATASEDNTVRLWDGATGQLMWTSNHERWVISANFSPDGAKLVTASGDGTARIWNTRNGQSEFVLKHPDKVRYAIYSPDGDHIATACDDGLVRIWDVRTHRVIRELSGHTKPVLSISFSPDRRWLASSSEDETARIWDAHTARLVHTLTGHVNYVMSVNFSPDSKRIVTTSWDQSIQLWDTASGRHLAAFRDHRQQANWAVFSPDGTRLLVTFKDEKVQLLDSLTLASRWEAASSKAR